MKAVVLEVRGREAALLMSDGTVRKARGRFEVGQEIEYMEPARVSPRQWVAAVVIAALLLSLSAGMWINANYVACAEVSLDVNPSIVYSLNRRDRVLSVRAVNEDAAPVVEALEADGGVRFAPLSDAVAKTLTIFADEGWLDDSTDDYLLASVASDDANAREKLAAQVETAIEQTRERDASLEYRVDRTDRATARAAEENGMSPGRYSAWKQAEGDAKPEDYAEMPVRQIMGRGKPAVEAAEKAADRPEERPAEQPEDRAAEKAAEQPEEKAAEKVEEKPAEKPSEKPDETPAEKTEEKPSEKPAETPAEKAEEKPSEKPAETPAEKAEEKPAERPGEKFAEKSDEQPAAQKSEPRQSDGAAAKSEPRQSDGAAAKSEPRQSGGRSGGGDSRPSSGASKDGASKGGAPGGGKGGPGR